MFQNSPSWVNFGRSDIAIEFNGTDDYVVVPNSPSLRTLSALTIEAWVKPDNLVENDALILSKSDEYQLLWSTGGLKTYLKTDTGTSITTFGTGGNTFPASRWTHITMSWDGTDIKEYINGTLARTTSLTGNSIFDANSPLNMGSSFKGIMDEVLIYGRALSSTEIGNRYNMYAGRTKLWNARAGDDYTYDSGIQSGIQAGDRVIIRFDGEITPVLIDESNIC